MQLRAAALEAGDEGTDDEFLREYGELEEESALVREVIELRRREGQTEGRELTEESTSSLPDPLKQRHFRPQ